MSKSAEEEVESGEELICRCNHSWDKDTDCICKEEDSEEDSEEEEEYEYTAYSLGKMFKVRIFVGGAGYIEGEWKTEEDFNNGEEGEIFYCNYSSDPPTRRYEGTKIVWGEDDNFNVE